MSHLGVEFAVSDMSKLISIIIATYNSELTLEKCLDSIVVQKCNSVELIIIDGNSIDGTLEVLKRYEGDIDYLVSEPDDGIYDAWNKGISASKGAWLMFIGSDDELRPDCIKRYKQQIEIDSDYDYISGRIMLVSQTGGELREFGQRYSWDVFKKIMNLAHVSALHNRRLYETYGNYDSSYKICGDYELLLRPKGLLKVKFVDALFANMAIGGISYGSFVALFEARNAKLQHKVNNRPAIFIQYYFAVLMLILKRIFFRKRLFGATQK